MSYVTTRHCTSSDVAPAQDFGGLKSNPQMEEDLQVKTVWNSYLMAFFFSADRDVSSWLCKVTDCISFDVHTKAVRLLFFELINSFFVNSSN